jgi:hypothetical protein
MVGFGSSHCSNKFVEQLRASQMEWATHRVDDQFLQQEKHITVDRTMRNSLVLILAVNATIILVRFSPDQA